MTKKSPDTDLKTHSPIIRPRRLRYNPTLRSMLQDVSLTKHDLVLPLFIKEDCKKPQAIRSMSGHYQLGINHLKAELDDIVSLGIPAILLFGIPTHKDAQGSASWQDDGIIQQAIRLCKQHAPDLLIMADCCFCEYTDHGHCGPLDHAQDVDNDATLALLCKQALSFTQAGADVIAPSGMMDGMVLAIRQYLDIFGYYKTPIMSYAVKYCSALYGPFREAAQGTPQFGDRSTYQLDYSLSNIALQEAKLDIEQGADIIMVKPATFYLDIIYKLKQTHPDIPMAAYQVSGEFAMLRTAIDNGLLNEKAIFESLIACKRAGANILINYFSKDVARWLNAHN
jgi:porphobilinogen synthase